MIATRKLVDLSIFWLRRLHIEALLKTTFRTFVLPQVCQRRTCFDKLRQDLLFLSIGELKVSCAFVCAYLVILYIINRVMRIPSTIVLFLASAVSSHQQNYIPPQEFPKSWRPHPKPSQNSHWVSSK